MENTRQLKISRQIQKDLGEIIRLRGMATYGGAMVTVSEVRVTQDLSIAKIYLSIFPSAKAEETLKRIVAETKPLRAELGKRVRHQLRIVPELHFYIDETLDKLAQIDELLKK